MNVTLEKQEDGTGIITVNVTEQDYADKVTKQLKEIGKTHTIPGFRKGHISVDQLRRRFGKEVKSDIINREVIDAALDYIRDNKINCLGQIMPVEVKEINLEDKDYTFQYEVGVAPEVDVKLDKDITVPFYTIEVTEDMIKEQNEDLTRRFGAQVTGEEVTEDALVKGTIMELNEDGTVKENGIQNVNGILGPKYLKDKEQAALFIGKKIGDKVVFNPAKATDNNAAELASMLGIDKNAVENANGNFEFNIADIIVLKPAEHNEEFFTQVFGPECKTQEQYDEQLKNLIAAQLAPNSQILFDRTAEQVLVEKYNDMKLPANFLKKWLVKEQEGLTAENIDEEFNRMEPAVKWEVIKGKIINDNNIEVKQEDVEQYAKLSARRQLAQYGMANADDEFVDSFAKRMMGDKETLRQMYEQVGDRKLFMCIRALVNVEEKQVSIDEFRKIANPENAKL